MTDDTKWSLNQKEDFRPRTPPNAVDIPTRNNPLHRRIGFQQWDDHRIIPRSAPEQRREEMRPSFLLKSSFSGQAGSPVPQNAAPASVPTTQRFDTLPGNLSLRHVHLDRRIGKGSFSTVYKARLHSRTVAVKAISLTKLSRKLLKNLTSEIRILAVMSEERHAHVVNLLGWDRSESHLSLVLEWCTWGDLSGLLKARGKIKLRIPEGLLGDTNKAKLSPNADQDKSLLDFSSPRGGLDLLVVKYFIGQLSSALAFLKKHLLIHRDLKPGNLLLHPPPRLVYKAQEYSRIVKARAESDAGSSDASPMPLSDSTMSPFGSTTALPVYTASGIPLSYLPILKVADFGFAKALPTEDAMTHTLCGSPLYMAPEILRYEGYSVKADLWSTGVIAYECVWGRTPWKASNHVELLRKIEQGRDQIPWPTPSTVQASSPQSKGKAAAVQDDEDERVLKQLITNLLKQRADDRIDPEDFFQDPLVLDGLDLADQMDLELKLGESQTIAVAPGTSPNLSVPVSMTPKSTRGSDRDTRERTLTAGEPGYPRNIQRLPSVWQGDAALTNLTRHYSTPIPIGKRHGSERAMAAQFRERERQDSFATRHESDRVHRPQPQTGTWLANAGYDSGPGQQPCDVPGRPRSRTMAPIAQRPGTRIMSPSSSTTSSIFGPPNIGSRDSQLDRSMLRFGPSRTPSNEGFQRSDIALDSRRSSQLSHGDGEPDNLETSSTGMPFPFSLQETPTYRSRPSSTSSPKPPSTKSSFNRLFERHSPHSAYPPQQQIPQHHRVQSAREASYPHHWIDEHKDSPDQDYVLVDKWDIAQPGASSFRIGQSMDERTQGHPRLVVPGNSTFTGSPQSMPPLSTAQLSVPSSGNKPNSIPPPDSSPVHPSAHPSWNRSNIGARVSNVFWPHGGAEPAIASPSPTSPGAESRSNSAFSRVISAMFSPFASSIGAGGLAIEGNTGGDRGRRRSQALVTSPSSASPSPSLSAPIAIVPRGQRMKARPALTIGGGLSESPTSSSSAQPGYIGRAAASNQGSVTSSPIVGSNSSSRRIAVSASSQAGSVTTPDPEVESIMTQVSRFYNLATATHISLASPLNETKANSNAPVTEYSLLCKGLECAITFLRERRGLRSSATPKLGSSPGNRTRSGSLSQSHVEDGDKRSQQSSLDTIRVLGTRLLGLSDAETRSHLLPLFQKLLDRAHTVMPLADAADIEDLNSEENKLFERAKELQNEMKYDEALALLEALASTSLVDDDEESSGPETQTDSETRSTPEPREPKDSETPGRPSSSSSSHSGDEKKRKTKVRTRKAFTKIQLMQQISQVSNLLSNLTLESPASVP